MGFGNNERMVFEKQVNELKIRTGCNEELAKKALREREGLMLFAVEFVKGYPFRQMSTESKCFPRWTEYKKEDNK